MNQREQNIISTLDMLVALQRQQQIFKNVWTPEQLNTLQVTKEHISDARLSVPAFLNSLDELAKKGYLINNSIISQQQRNQLDEVQSGNYNSEIKDELTKIDTPETQRKLKVGIANFLKNTMPKDCEFDEEEFMASEISFEDLMNCGLQYITDTTDLVAVVILMPFRNINRLLSKMNTGMSFDEVKDPGLWYNPESFTLYCDDKEYSTKYRNDPTLVHFIFESLFKQPNETLDYLNVETDKTIRACFDSSLHFIKKYPELDPVFSITKGSIEIKPEYLNDVH